MYQSIFTNIMFIEKKKYSLVQAGKYIKIYMYFETFICLRKYLCFVLFN